MTEFDTSRFAVIADIHGNVDALEAVLHDIADLGIESIVNLGDHLSGPMAPKATADLLMDREMKSIRGNHDRWLLETPREEMCSVDRVAIDELEPQHLEWLGGLAPTLWISDEVFACHGTPTSDVTYWAEQVAPDGRIVTRAPSDMRAEAGGFNASLFLCGHSHLPRRLDLAHGCVLLNPGSIGCPAYVDDLPVRHVVETGTSAACYAVVEKKQVAWATSFRHVPYDPSRMIALAEAHDHVHWGIRLTTGRVA